jgi:hypothetical protein
MNVIFESDYNPTELRDKLNDLIEYQREDNLSSHLQNIFSKRMDSISGKVESNDFVIWRHSYIWSDMFYSVINGRIINNRNSCCIELKSKLNIFGSSLAVMISILLGYGILTGIVIQNDNSFRFIIWRLLVGLILFLLMQTVPIIAYFDSKRRTIKILTENLKLIKNVC